MRDRQEFRLGLFDTTEPTLLDHPNTLRNCGATYLGSFLPAAPAIAREAAPSLPVEGNLRIIPTGLPEVKHWDMWRADCTGDAPIHVLVRAKPDDAGILYNTPEYASNVALFKLRLDSSRLLLLNACRQLPGATVHHDFRIAELLWHQDGSYFAVLRSNFCRPNLGVPQFSSLNDRYVLVFFGTEAQCELERGWCAAWKKQLQFLCRATDAGVEVLCETVEHAQPSATIA